MRRRGERPSYQRSLIVYREPDGWRRFIGPGDAMTGVGGNVHIAAGIEPNWLSLAFENQARRPCKDEHPLGPILIIPCAKRGGLTGRDDSLDSKIRRGEQLHNLFLRKPLRHIFKQIACN